MTANSKIEWTDHTFNPWIGCQAVSPACDHCYAEKLVNGRMRGDFSQRRRTSDSNWRQPLAWNRKAEKEGRRYRVFCASLADVFDNQAEEMWRADLWQLIEATPHLDWLLLTKRPQNVQNMLPTGWGDGWPNVWLGTTVENQTEADRRIPHLLKVPAKVRFLSCEPLLGPVDLTAVRWPCPKEHYVDVLRGGYWNMAPHLFGAPAARPGEPRGGFTNHSDMPGQPGMIRWVIAGGESGPGARPMHPDWARSLRDQCAEAGVAFHFKQWGEWGVSTPHTAWAPAGSLKAFTISSSTDRKRIGRTIYEAGSGEGQPSAILDRIGKARAGRLLDGREHNAVPQ